ncbi:MAG: glycoside hydrolase family 31 protein [Phycisphaerae bacterium]|nr:glycoside hydrolase family 31 protein [Phycisphaerae bacterium]
MSISAIRRVLLLAVLLAWGSPASAQWNHLEAVAAYDLDDAVLTLECGSATVRIEAVSEHVIRVRLAPEGRFGRDFSWAVLDSTPKGKFSRLQEAPAYIQVSTGALEVVVQRDPCRLKILGAGGEALVVDDPARGMAWGCTSESSMAAVRVWQQLPDKVAIYGLGEKTGALNKRGRAWTMWNTDECAYGLAEDPIYKSVPFFICARNGRFHGVFFDNPWRSSFDFGQRDRGILSFGAEGGELNYYVIAGPDPKDVVRRYTALTGRMELPPKWALGYHQSRYSYCPEAHVREVASTFRQKRIPCDVIYFDIDYMDGYRCFTWNPKHFPDPKKLMGDLHEMGFHTVAIIDPGIKQDPGYFVYDEGTKRSAWLTKPDGETYVGRVWPGPAVFPDFTNPQVRRWWSSLYPPFLDSCGIDGIWNDMNEPSDFDGPNKTVPLNLRHDNEGEPASHRACHNIYGMQMARATFAGLEQARPDRRPFVITRAAYAGGQRYGASWTGDNISTWGHLRMSIPMVLNLGVSGMPFVGPDIGGFVVGATPQLYARWIQVGSLLPFCRTHTGWSSPNQEPWSFGPEVEEIARQSLERRYAMMPYLYTLFEESTRTGLPIIRPPWMEFPEVRGWHFNVSFMLGPDVYVIPIDWPDAREATRPLPPGAWFDLHTGLIHGGGQWVKLDVDLKTLPMFVRAGAIIPMQSPVQSTTHAPDEPLILDVWPFGDSVGWLYEDDGQSLSYRKGEFRRTRFQCRVDGDTVHFTMLEPEGSYVPPKRAPLVRFHGLTSAIERVVCTHVLSGEGLTAHPSEETVTREHMTAQPSVAAPGEFHYDRGSGTWLVRMCPDNGKSQQLHVTLTSAGVDDSPVRFDFTDADSSIVCHNEILPPVSVDGAVLLRIQSTFGKPHIVLPRLKLSADKLPILKLRLSTEHTSRIEVRFATEQDPTLSAQSLISFAVTPDGEFHEYTVDLAGACEGKWAGMVYWLSLGFAEGVCAGEVIKLDRLSFEGGVGR